MNLYRLFTTFTSVWLILSSISGCSTPRIASEIAAYETAVATATAVAAYADQIGAELEAVRIAAASEQRDQAADLLLEGFVLSVLVLAGTIVLLATAGLVYHFWRTWTQQRIAQYDLHNHPRDPVA
jgi:hypothetical protein